MSEHGRRDPKHSRSKAAGAKSRTGSPATESLWSVPVLVAEIPQTGRHIDLVADATVREAIAKALGVLAVLRLEGTFDVAPVAKDGLRVSGLVSAAVEQSCVVTLDPVTSEIEFPVDLVFMPPGAALAPEIAAAGSAEDVDPPELLHDGAVDLGAIATEFFILGIDPYPRKQGVSFEAPQVAADPEAHPFAALAALKKDSSPKSR